MASGSKAVQAGVKIELRMLQLLTGDHLAYEPRTVCKADVQDSFDFSAQRTSTKNLAELFEEISS